MKEFKNLLDTLIEESLVNQNNLNLSELNKFMIDESIKTVMNCMFIWILKKNFSRRERLAILKFALSTIKKKVIKEYNFARKNMKVNIDEESFYIDVNKNIKEVETRLHNILVK